MTEEQRKIDMEVFEAEAKKTALQLPNHKLKEFTLNTIEQQMLAEQETIVALARASQDKIINEYVLSRVGVTPSPAIHIRYSISLGRFVVYTPKLPKGSSKEKS